MRLGALLIRRLVIYGVPQSSPDWAERTQRLLALALARSSSSAMACMIVGDFNCSSADLPSGQALLAARPSRLRAEAVRGLTPPFCILRWLRCGRVRKLKTRPPLTRIAPCGWSFVSRPRRQPSKGGPFQGAGHRRIREERAFDSA